MKTTEADYPSRAVEATRRVLLELARVLGEYGDHIVLVGGWVPELLAPGAGHVGSTDVDLALDHVALSDTGYARLRDLLEGGGLPERPRSGPPVRVLPRRGPRRRRHAGPRCGRAGPPCG